MKIQHILQGQESIAPIETGLDCAMDASTLTEQSFGSGMELVQHIIDNYNKASGKNWKAELVNVEHLKTDQYSKAKNCFNNAFRYMLHKISKQSTYVLGYVFIHGIPLEHAWVHSAGKYIDTTIDSAKQDEYVKVVELSFKEINAFVSNHGHAPTLYDAMKL
jgi:hypothetical protein